MLYRTILLIVFLVIFLFVSGCSKNRPPISTETEGAKEVYIVRIPPKYDPNLTPAENQCIFSAFLFPHEGTTNVKEACSGAELANDDGLLYLKVQDDGSFLLNSQSTVEGRQIGSLSDPQPLTDILRKTFYERAKAGVFEPESNRVVKAIGIKLPIKSEYSDLITLVRTVKEADADPIVLLLDGYLPYVYVGQKDSYSNH